MTDKISKSVRMRPSTAKAVDKHRKTLTPSLSFSGMVESLIIQALAETASKAAVKP